MSQNNREAIAMAISLAMARRWREAISVNKPIINNFPNDVNAYNRLGRAHMELGEYAQAKEAYQRTLEFDPVNTIAKKNLQRLSQLGKRLANPKATPADDTAVEPRTFIEEVGKTGINRLQHLAQPEKIARMVPGDKVHLKINGPNLTVEDGRGEYLGLVEPKHSQRLVKLMTGGNRYSAAIVNATDSSVTIIIKEIYQNPSQVGKVSFPYQGVEVPRTSVGEMIFKREQQHNKGTKEKSGYSIVDGEGVSVPMEEPLEKDEDEMTEDEE